MGQLEMNPTVWELLPLYISMRIYPGRFAKTIVQLLPDIQEERREFQLTVAGLPLGKPNAQGCNNTIVFFFLMIWGNHGIAGLGGLSADRVSHNLLEANLVLLLLVSFWFNFHPNKKMHSNLWGFESHEPPMPRLTRPPRSKIF